MRRITSIFPVVALVLAVGCTAPPEAPQPRPPATAPEAGPASEAGAKSPAETVPQAPEPPRAETAPPEGPATPPGRAMPKDLEGVKRRLLATQGKGGPKAAPEVTLATAVEALPAFADGLVKAIAAGDEDALAGMVLTPGEIEEVFVPSIARIVRQGERDWLTPIRTRLAGATVRKVTIASGEHGGRSMGSRVQRVRLPSAFNQVIQIETETGSVRLLLREAFYVGGAWKVFRMELGAVRTDRP